MATTALIPVAEYLATSYRPDRDYIDGEVRERNLGEKPHSGLQTYFAHLFLLHEDAWKLYAYTEQRVQVSPTRFRIPDVCAVRFHAGDESGIVRTPPLICIELLSPGDSLSDMQERVADYQAFGVENIWLIDPVKRYAWIATARGLTQEQEAFTVPGTSVRIELSTLYARLDRLAADR